MIKFTIPGEPKGKGRPRMTKKGHTYTPSDTVSYENWVKQCFIMDYQNCIPTESPLKVDIKAFYSIPASKSNKQKTLMLCGDIRPTKKPDMDNIAKIVLDSLNGLAYKDDSQIVELRLEKWYSKNPRVEVTIWRIQND